MNTNRQLIEQFLQFINTGDAAVGKPIISDDVIKDGKIIREHGLPDMFSLLMQLGVIPAPGQ